MEQIGNENIIEEETLVQDAETQTSYILKKILYCTTVMSDQKQEEKMSMKETTKMFIIVLIKYEGQNKSDNNMRFQQSVSERMMILDLTLRG